VEVVGLRLVLVLGRHLAEVGERARVRRHAREQVRVVLGGCLGVAELLVQARDVADDLRARGHDGVQLFEGLQRLAERAELAVHEAEVEDGLGAVRLDADGL
jgi:hypothetical protein